MNLSAEDFTPLEAERKKHIFIEESQSTYWKDAYLRFKKNKLAVIATFVLLGIILMCIVGPLLSPHNYHYQDIRLKNQPPSSDNWFGTDYLGRDIFTRLWIGGRISLGIAFLGAFLDCIIGVFYGGISGYYGGKVDKFMMRFVEILVSIPYLVVVVLVSLIVGKGFFSMIIALTITGWCQMARIVRGQVLQLREQDYVLAAKALGTSPIKIISRHLIPNAMSVIIVTVAFDIPSFIFGEAFLSFIGLGIQAPLSSWGTMVSAAQQSMAFYPYQLFFPAFLISITMLSFQLIGDGLRDALDPKSH